MSISFEAPEHIFSQAFMPRTAIAARKHVDSKKVDKGRMCNAFPVCVCLRESEKKKKKVFCLHKP